VEVVAVDDVVIVVDGGPGDEPLLTRAGLLGVRERCEAVGGTAELDGHGRVLRCTLPGVDDWAGTPR
jgi:signal transduction histidine kinase